MSSTKILLYSFMLCYLFGINNIQAQSVFDERIKINREISFENLLGKISFIDIDKSGSFIVTNFSKKNISTYDPSGELAFEYGRPGMGPGDFSFPLTTIRLSSGQLLTAEFQGKISVFNATGDSLIKIYNVELIPLSDVLEIDKDRILLIGNKLVDKQTKLLHIFDLKTGIITKSFFDLPFSLREDYGGILGSIGKLVIANVHAGKIAAMITPFPMIHVFDDDAQFIKSIDLSLNDFKTIENKNRVQRRDELASNMTTFSMILNLFWFDNNTFIITYYHLNNLNFPDNFEMENSLAHVGINGELFFEIHQTPLLRNVYSSKLYFESMNSEGEISLLEGVIKN